MWFIGVEIEQDTSAPPSPPKKKSWIRPCYRYYLRAEILKKSEFLKNIILTCNQSKQMGLLQRIYLNKLCSLRQIQYSSHTR